MKHDTDGSSPSTRAYMPLATMRPPGNQVAATPKPVPGILGAIGNTPLVALRRLCPEGPVNVFAKMERANPGGSIKDRPAAAILQTALQDGRLVPGGTVIESSSGNMGVGLAQACRVLGLRFICVCDIRADPTKLTMMRVLGADVHIIREPDPLTGDMLTARLHEVQRLLDQHPGAFWPDQYASSGNPRAHRDGTMSEIDKALEGDVAQVIVATSTAGTLAGCADFVEAHRRNTTIVGVDAVGSVLWGGRRGERRLPGMGSGIETVHSGRRRADRLVRVTELDCVAGCLLLATSEAIVAGASSGGVVAALAATCPRPDVEENVVLILPDGGDGYLNTIYDQSWVRRELGHSPTRVAERVAELSERLQHTGPDR